MTDPAPPPRSCGSCTLCCKLLIIAELDKPAGRWCQHCAPGKGCGVYETRPEPCRTFFCQWLTNTGLPDSLRPDRSKVMLTLTKGPMLNAYCDPANPLAWRREPIHGMLRERARRGGLTAVVARAGLRMWLINPDHDTDLGEIPLDTPIRFEHLANGVVRATVMPAGSVAKPT